MQTEELGRLKVSKEPTGNWKRDTILGNSVICDSVGANNQNKYLRQLIFFTAFGESILKSEVIVKQQRFIVNLHFKHYIICF